MEGESREEAEPKTQFSHQEREPDDEWPIRDGACHRRVEGATMLEPKHQSWRGSTGVTERTVCCRNAKFGRISVSDEARLKTRLSPGCRVSARSKADA
jgi:hypothetical protein